MILAIEEAKAKRKCTICEAPIERGANCVHVNVAGFRGASHANICLTCFRGTVTNMEASLPRQIGAAL
jgi:hypothetical protein